MYVNSIFKARFSGHSAWLGLILISAFLGRPIKGAIRKDLMFKIEEGGYRCQDRMNKGKLTTCEFTLQKSKKSPTQLLLLMDGAGCLAKQVEVQRVASSKNLFANDIFGVEMEVKSENYFIFRSAMGPVSQVCSREQGMARKTELREPRHRMGKSTYSGYSNREENSTSHNSNNRPYPSKNPSDFDNFNNGFDADDPNSSDWGFPDFQEFPYNDDQSFEF